MVTPILSSIALKWTNFFGSSWKQEIGYWFPRFSRCLQVNNIDFLPSLSWIWFRNGRRRERRKRRRARRRRKGKVKIRRKKRKIHFFFSIFHYMHSSPTYCSFFPLFSSSSTLRFFLFARLSLHSSLLFSRYFSSCYSALIFSFIISSSFVSPFS